MTSVAERHEPFVAAYETAKAPSANGVSEASTRRRDAIAPT